MEKHYDYVIIGAGLYGLYSALLLSKKKEREIVILEHDSSPFQRATFINQARVHNGYHYPRSISTALKSASYFEKFNKDFNFAINASFKKIYAIARDFSYTNGEQFEKFCKSTNIPFKEVHQRDLLNDSTIEKAYETKEFSFDAEKIKEYLLHELSKRDNVSILYNTHLTSVQKNNHTYRLVLNDLNNTIITPFVINATYAGINQMLDKFGFEKFKIKYEICEIITCSVSDNMKNVGITVMDGPFFSLMPFGLTGMHSLTSVEFTPHMDSQDDLPTFPCQKLNQKCTPRLLQNCNTCPAQPRTAWPYMSQLAKKYLNDHVEIFYQKSYFAIKPILKVSELDDSRPTVIREFSKNPTFLSVLSGKINTIYDLDTILL